MKIKKEKNTFLFNLLLITIFWNVWFPKAGTKISGIPLTIGNVFFAITFCLWLFDKIREKKFKIPSIGGLVIFGILYFIIKYTIIYVTTNEIISSIGYIIPLCVYPLILFVTYDLVDNKEKLYEVIKIIVYGFFFLCIYALIQTIVGIEKCDIPGLTVNYSDYKKYGELWFMTKANGTDINNAKIVGTYQNGNLFGISLILIYPLVYNYYKEIKNNKMLIFSLVFYILMVFLTLSRACWLGIVLFVWFGIFLEREKTKQSIVRKIAIVIIGILSIIYAFNYLPSVANRFFNTNIKDWISMSGRTEGLIEVFKSLKNSNSVFAYIIGPHGITKYTGLAYEMMPLSVFVQTGIIGLSLLYSVFFIVETKLTYKNFVSKSIKLSIFVWLIVGCIECGYWLPPAALNVFMLIAIGLKADELFKEENE